MKAVILTTLLSLLVSTAATAQDTASVRWLTFEQLEVALATDPKPVFISFYTDWCAYCRKMDKAVFTQPDVIERLNSDYYAVRFDAETKEVVHFGGRRLVNDMVGKSRRPLHQIAQLLALRRGEFVAPAMVILDASFSVESRYFEYLDSRRLMEVLAR